MGKLLFSIPRVRRKSSKLHLTDREKRRKSFTFLHTLDCHVKEKHKNEWCDDLTLQGEKHVHTFDNWVNFADMYETDNCSCLQLTCITSFWSVGFLCCTVGGDFVSWIVVTKRKMLTNEFTAWTIYLYLIRVLLEFARDYIPKHFPTNTIASRCFLRGCSNPITSCRK